MEVSQALNTYFGAMAGMVMMTILTVGFVIFNIRYHKRIIYQNQILNDQKIAHNEDLIRSNIESIEQERGRIASDIHDELGAVFATLHLYLNRINEDQKLNLEVVRDGKLLVTQGINSVRRISHSLMPPELELLGLKYTLELFTNQVIAASGNKMSLVLNMNFESFPKNVELAIYRISMELISNTIKHASATQIEIEIFNQDSQLNYFFRDNGKGFLFDSTAKNEGMGLKNIESRAIALNGEMTIKTKPNEGFDCIIIFPIIINKDI